MTDRKRVQYRSQVQRFKRRLLLLQDCSLKDLLPGDVLHKVIEQAVSLRDLIYTPLVTLGLFLRQVLNDDASCKNIVASFRAERLQSGLGSISVNTGPYCKARARLPLDPLQELVRRSGAAGDRHARASDLWLGRWNVKLADGTTMLLQDTQDNQDVYPQPKARKPGLGFPMVRMVALISLSVGTVLDYALGPYQGKQTGEASLFARLLGGLRRGDLLLADRYYATYAFLALLSARGGAALMKQHARRNTDFRTGRRLGARDHIVIWIKPKIKPIWMSDAEFEALPAQLEVREFRVNRVVYVTTLLDAKTYHKNALAKLYEQRWNIELDLRSIKTHMGMEMLRCLTHEMVEKEIAVNLLAYNLIRAHMAEAAQQYDKVPRQLSFKASVQLYLHAVAQWGSAKLTNLRIFIVELLRGIASTPVGIFKKDPQPRAKKRRPKTYPLLMKPRSVLKDALKRKQAQWSENQCAA